MATVSAEQVALQIGEDGGSPMQQLVGAALVSGVESNGDPTELSGGIGPAAGLFQFEPDTWKGNGGSQFAPVAQDASWQDQVQVFVNATQGDNFGDWGPDLGGGYGYTGPPKPGSPVANKLADPSLASVVKAINAPGVDATSIPTLGGAASEAASATGLGGIAGLESDADAALHDVTSTTFWKRVGMGYLGASLIILGLVVFFESTDTGKKATQTAAMAAAA